MAGGNVTKDSNEQNIFLRGYDEKFIDNIYLWTSNQRTQR